tara:strand:+ start:141 stop:587 length:447 start_codon:yes stop_codon:yes gene_type:complete
MEKIWIIFAVIAMFVSGIHTICLKYINNKFIDIGLAFIFLFAGFLSLIYILFKNNRFKNFLKEKNSKNVILTALLIGIFIIIFNSSLLYSINNSPKVSYCLLIVNLNIIITLLIGYFLFKEKLNIKTFIGILLSLIGLSIVIYYSNEK